MQVDALQMTPVQLTGESHLGENKVHEVKSFGDYLVEAIKNTNDLQNQSDQMNKMLAAGQVNDISQVVLASEKADIAMQLTLQVRNRVVDAYQEVMRMQV